MNNDFFKPVTSRRSFFKTCLSSSLLTVGGSNLLTSCATTSPALESNSSSATHNSADGYDKFSGLLLSLNPAADAILSSPSSDKNFGNRGHLSAGAWTYSGQPGSTRSLIKFDIPSQLDDYKLLLARLFLFAETMNPIYGQGTYNSEPIGHSQLRGSNEWLLVPVASPWSEETVTWVTQPSTVSDNQLFLPASRSASHNYEIDITHLVQMYLDTGVNYGFLMQLRTENHYRQVTFYSRKATNVDFRPRLDLYYTER